MHRLVPQFILDRYSNKKLSGTLKASVLFVDIAGFSNLTDELMQKAKAGSEQLAEIMRSVLSPMIDNIYHHNGFVVTLAGDAITALFPEAKTLQANRALDCVSQLPSLFKDSEHNLSARFGLAYGKVQWGIIESEIQTQASYYFAGDSIGKAAKSQQQAPKNQILIHESLYKQVASTHDSDIELFEEGLYFYSKRSSLLPSKNVQAPPTSLDSSQAFFPKQLLKQDFPGEFRHVVNVFIQLPDELEEQQLQSFMQSVFALQRRYGGILNRLDFSDKGTHLYLFWGAPTAYETDIERALSFVLDLQNQGGIAISAGLSYRMSHAGFIGSSLREEYTCYGRGVNLAARLMVQAAPGDIWLDEDIAKRAEKGFDIELEGDFSFKGFTKQEKVYVLYERKEQVETFFDSTLLGREEELKTLEGFLKSSFEKQDAPQLLVFGEAGIGKSHLLHALENADSQANKAYWLTCQSDQILITSLNPFAYALKRYFGTSDTQSESRNKRNFQRRLTNLIVSCTSSALADELDRTQSFLGALIGLRWSDSLYEQLEPQGRLENTFLALIAFFQVLSLEQALVVLIEDVHWLDEDSKAFLLRLQRVLRAREENHPIVLLLTARPTQDVLPESLDYATLELTTLSQKNIQSLTTHLIGEASADVIDIVFERSQGNPFFAEQVIRFLQDEKLIEQINATWQLIKELPISAVPTDVRTVLIARIDRLSQDLKDLVQTAAILGREFEVQLLSQIMQSDDLSRKLSEAEQAAIWTALNELRYLFKHALLRDAAYDMQLVSRRKALHQVAVEALETLYKDDLINHYAELAYHSEQADLTEKAKAYLELAGDSAKEAYQNEQAIDFYSRALALMTSQNKQYFELKLKRATIYGWLGQHELQAEELEGLMEASERFDKDAQIRVLLIKARYFLDRNLSGDTIQTVNQAIQLCDEEVDLEHLFKCHIFLAHAYIFHKNGSEREHFYANIMLATNYAERSEDEELKTESLTWLGLYYRYQDDEQAKTYFEEALFSTSKLSKRINLLNRLGSIARRAKKFEKAKQYYQEALELSQKTGRRYNYCLTLYSFGLLYQDMRDYDNAESYFSQVVIMGDELGNDYAYRGRYSVARALANKGNLEQAIKQYKEVYNLIPKTNDNSILDIVSELALFSWRFGDTQEAEAYEKQFLELLDPQFSYDEMWTLVNLATIYLELSKFQEANEVLAKAQTILVNPERLETYFGMSIKHLDLVDAAIKVTMANIALEQNIERAGQLMDDVLSTFVKYESQSYFVDDVQWPSSELFHQTFMVLKALNRPEASNILNEAYKRIMDLSRKIGKTEEAQKQVWIEDKFRRGIVEAWQAENR